MRAGILMAAELRADARAIAPWVQRVDAALSEAAPWDEDARLLVAVAIHHGYGALEAGLERIARAMEGMNPSTDRWHQHLLSQMFLEMDGLRPAVLQEALKPALRELLGFRHLFRHAYATPLEPVRLRELAVQFREVMPQASRALEDFAALLVSS